MILFDECIKLRAIEEEDALVLQEMINSPEIEYSVVGHSFPVSLAEQRKWIQGLSDNQVVRYAVDNGKGIVGMASISAIDMRNRTANLNIKLREQEQGKGYASRAVKLMIRYCYQELGLICLTAQILERNEKSKKLFEKLGFRLDGVLRSRVYKNGERHNLMAYSLLKDEYENGNWQ